MSDDKVTLTIDDQLITVPKSMNVVDAAKTAGIDIPVFCYHEKLGQLGCCRMCLVEIEKMPKLMTACTTQVQEGMVVHNNTDKVDKGRKGVLEFTLLNHPLDCPVCDKGGECPLQDNTFKYGPDETRMDFNRHNNVKKKPLSPVITLDRERCIACQRCTRYSEVIEQDQGLVMLNRGFHNDVSTFNNEDYDSRFSGNVVDICPVGALTNTVFRFSARSWDLDNAKTLCAHCGCNCNITFGARGNQLKRITSRPNDLVDDGWICDKGRWGYEFLNNGDRILEAVFRKDTEFELCSVEEALVETARRLESIVDEHGSGSVGFIGSPYGSNEELYLYQKLFRTQLKSNNIDHKVYAGGPGLPIAHYDIMDIESADLIVLIASDPTEELPILELRLKKAVTRCNTRLIVLNDQKTVMDKYAGLSIRYDIGAEGFAIAALTDALAKDLEISSPIVGEELAASAGIDNDDVKNAMNRIRSSKKTCVIYNPAALNDNAYDITQRLLTIMMKIPGSECGAIPAAPYTNAVGALDMGVTPAFYPGGISVEDSQRVKKIWGEEVPLAPGLSSIEMIEKAAGGELKALVVFRANPLADFPGGNRVKSALEKLECLIVHDMIATETSKMAHIIIPSNGPVCDEGTTTNIGGRVQLRRRGLTANNIPDWKIVARMINELGGGVRYQDALSVTAEIAKNVPGYEHIRRGSIQKEGKLRGEPSNVVDGLAGPGKDLKQKGLRLRVVARLFVNDKILSKNSSLAHHFAGPEVLIHESDARKLGLGNGDLVRISAGEVELKVNVVIGDYCNPGGVILPRVSDSHNALGLLADSGFGGCVELRR